MQEGLFDHLEEAPLPKFVLPSKTLPFRQAYLDNILKPALQRLLVDSKALILSLPEVCQRFETAYSLVITPRLLQAALTECGISVVVNDVAIVEAIKPSRPAPSTPLLRATPPRPPPGGVPDFEGFDNEVSPSRPLPPAGPAAPSVGYPVIWEPSH